MSSYSRTAPDENRIRKFLAPYVIIGLILIGMTDAILVAHANYTGRSLYCPIIDGCNTVLNSPYSRVFGVPMSYFGFVYYLYMFGLAVRLAFEPLSRILCYRAVLYAGLGVASSAYFMYLQLGFVRDVCSYCVISAVVTFFLFLVAVWHLQAVRKTAV
jgi:uncharacterized membrane protein